MLIFPELKSDPAYQPELGQYDHSNRIYMQIMSRLLTLSDAIFNNIQNK